MVLRLALCLALAPLQNEVAPAGTVALELSADFQEVPRRTGRQGASTVVGGTAFAPGSVGRFPFVVAVDASGAVEWTWTGVEDDVQAVGLFVPEAGQGAFVVDFDFTDEVRVRRLDAGTVTWESMLPGDPFGSTPLFDPVLELAGSADGSRLFALLERPGPVDLVVALDPTDGAPLWSVALPTATDPLDLACDVAGDSLAVLLGSSASTTDDRLWVLDGADGSLRLARTLSDVFLDGQPRRLAIDPAGDRVYVGGDADSAGAPNLLALELPGGDPTWTAAVDARVLALALDPLGPNLVVASSTAATGPGQPIRLTGVRPALGVPQWSRVLAVPGDNGAGPRLRLDPTLGRGALLYDSSSAPFGPSESTLELFDLESGAGLATASETSALGWSALAGGEFQTVDGQSAFVRVRGIDGGGGTADLDLTAFEVAGGAPLWTRTLAFDFAAPRVEALVADPLGEVAFATVIDSVADRRLVRVDLARGAVDWATVQPGPSIPFPNPAVGRALVTTADRSVVVTSRTAFSTTDLPELLAVDGDTGAALWARSLDGLGNAVDLTLVESGAPEPLVLSLHGNDGDSFGRTAVRATALDGDLAWVEEWPASGIGPAWASALAAAPEEGRVHALVASQWPTDELRVLSRRLADGALDGDLRLVDADFAPGVELGVPLGFDLERDAASGDLFVLGRYLGTAAIDSHLVCARVDPEAGGVVWGTALDPSPLSSWGPGELVRGPAAGVVALVASATSPDGQGTVEVLGVEAATGAVRWARTIGSADEPRALLDATPSVSGDALLLALDAGGAGELAALDLDTGVELWRAAVDGETEADRVDRIASVDGGALALVGAELAVPSGAAFLERLALAPLVVGPETLSLADPAPLVLHLDRAASASGAPYLVLGSLTGTRPPTPAGAVELPLVADAYTTLTLLSANIGPFGSTLGTLGPLGDARATVQLPPSLPPSLAGRELFHAFLGLGPAGADFASNAVGAALVR